MTDQQSSSAPSSPRYDCIAVKVSLNKQDRCLLTNLPLDFTFNQVLYEVVDSRSLFHLIQGGLESYSFQVVNKNKRINNKKTVAMSDVIGDERWKKLRTPYLCLNLKPELDHTRFAKLFYQPLEFTCFNPRHRCFDERGNAIPRVLKMSLDFLNENALEEVGVFRVSGSKGWMTEQIKQWDNAEYVPFNHKTITSNVASILKDYLRSLPDPLMESALYARVRSVFMGNDNLSDEDKALKVKKIIQSLPNGHYHCLERLMAFCNKVQKHKDKTQMDAKNLAVCLTPSILAPEKEEQKPATATSLYQNIEELTRISFAVSFMIEHYSSIFTKNSPYDPDLKGLESSGKGWKRKAKKFDADTSGTLVVEIISCNNLHASEKNASDPYVIITLGSQRFSTKKMKENLNPVYLEQFEFAVADSTTEVLDIKVYDHDNYSKHDPIGSATVPLSSAPMKRLAQKFTCDLTPRGGTIDVALIPLNYGEVIKEPKKKMSFTRTMSNSSNNDE